MSSLQEPVELIHVQLQDTSFCKVGVAEMQGLRATHEDAHFILPNDSQGRAHFGVLDGHGGSRSARLAARHLPSLLEGAFVLPQETDDVGLPERIKRAFVDTDKRLWCEMSEGKLPSGSTCVTSSIQLQGGKILCHLANAGDSRGIFWQRQRNVLTETLSHRPDLEVEKARIIAAGGQVKSVGMCHRLDGELAVSRGFADFRYKDMSVEAERHKLSCIPDIYTSVLDEGDFVILGCDGVFDFMGPQTIVQMLERQVGESPRFDIGSFCIRVLQRCLEVQRLSKSGQGDNMTLMVIHLGASDGPTFGATNEIYGIQKLEQVGLKRQKRLWHTFLEYCGEYGTLQPELAQKAYLLAREEIKRERFLKLQDYGLGELSRLPPSDKADVAKLLKTILEDLAANAKLDSRVRRVKLTSARMQKTIVAAPGVLNILLAIGYVREPEELVLPLSISPEEASKAAQSMRRRLDAEVSSAAALSSGIAQSGDPLNARVVSIGS